jgi:hypothetical protein
VPSWLDRGAELAGYPWATGAEMACCTLLQILLRYNKVPSWRPPALFFFLIFVLISPAFFKNRVSPIF